jgi:ubiquinone/menaquinone biosynthesis C-methylase UbiE
MDILTDLSSNTDYSSKQLQLIIGAWVVSGAVPRIRPKKKKKKISVSDGDVSEEDYSKQSIYSLLYSLYRTVGTVRSETGEPYEMTFNTWGYAWPKDWGTNLTAPDSDPQRFGKNAYTGLFQADVVQDYIKEHDGKVHVVEMGCGTGAGAHHICTQVLPKCTYEAVDMQSSAINTCKRRHVADCGGRLRATCADATELTIPTGSVDFVVVNETHVTERTGRTTPEDERFFRTAYAMLKPGGFLVWGNAIPDPTWQPCFDYLESIGMIKAAETDVTKEAVQARDEDAARVEAFVNQCLDNFHAFRIPKYGESKRYEARQAMRNFYRDPGTNLYRNMIDGTDTYRVVAFQKPLD